MHTGNATCKVREHVVDNAMGNDIFDSLRHLIADYGYWAVAVALLCENAGLPVPGETTLLLASFIAYSEHKLDLAWIIVVGTCAATLGDNIGYAIGHYGGRRLLQRYEHIAALPKEAIERGEKLFERYGSVTILFARFVFGMRVIAGPLAGVLRMPWRPFAIFNLLGAILWVTVIAGAGYLFGSNWQALANFVREFNIAVIVVVLVGVLIWWKWRRRAQSGKSDSMP